MTKRFAMQCCLNGMEADMLVELFGILDANLNHTEGQMVEGYPTGNCLVGMTYEDYGRILCISRHFSKKLGNLAGSEEKNTAHVPEGKSSCREK